MDFRAGYVLKTRGSVKSSDLNLRHKTMMIACARAHIPSFRQSQQKGASGPSAVIALRPTRIALAVCTLLGGGQAWAACPAAPSGATPSSDILVPASGDTVTCTGLAEVAILAPKASSVTVTVAAGGEVRSSTHVAPAIYLHSGSTITNAGRLFADAPGEGSLRPRGGVITLTGANHTINNTGTIEGRDGIAIQGAVQSSYQASNVTINNSGIIRTTNDTASSPNGTVNLRDGSHIINSGQILLTGGGSREVINVGDGSLVENLSTGVIRGTETRVWSQAGLAPTQSIGGVYLGDNSRLENAGLIEILAPVSGKGAAVHAASSNATIINTGTIDASTAEYAITTTDALLSSGGISIFNSGTIRGGSLAAISASEGNNGVLTLDTGSQITGSVTFRDGVRLPRTDAELGDQRVIDYCRANPTAALCTRAAEVLPTLATLRLQGTGTEDDKFSGFNLIEKLGAGTWALGTSLQAGSATGETGDFRGALTVNVADATGRLDMTGAISDASDATAGQVVKNGTGMLALSGNNTYSGATTINAGILQANGGNAIGDRSAVTVASGALLQLGASETIGSLAGAGDVLLQNNTLTTGNDNTSTTFSGTIMGTGGMAKTGTGTLRLTGTSTATGTLSVLGGALDAAGTLPMTVLVGRGGTLKGNGTVGGVQNTGVVTPGNSVGTLNASGNYTQTSTGIYQAEIRPDGSAADLVTVGGRAGLDGTLAASGENGALLSPAAGGTAASPKLYTILTAAGGVSGQFATTPAALGAFSFNTIYNANNVQLGVTYTGFSTPPGQGTTNQKTKAKYLNNVPFGATGYSSGNTDFNQVLLEIANESSDQLARTYNSIIAEPYAAFMTVLLNQNDFYANNVMDRAQACSPGGRATLGGAFAPNFGASDKSGANGCDQSQHHQRHGSWVNANWVRGSVDGDNDLSGYKYQMDGMVFGVDTSLGNDTAIGIAGGFGKPKLHDYELAQASIDGDSYFLSSYGTLTRDQWEFAGVLGYTFGNYDATRGINFGSINRQAKGSFDSQGVIASLKAAYSLPAMNRIEVVPEFGLTYSKIWQGGFSESGADSLNLKLENSSAYSMVSSVGVRVGTALDVNATPVRLQGLLRYDYDWNAGDDNAHTATASLAQLPTLGSMPIIGQNRGASGLTFGGTATVMVAKSVALFGGITYRVNENGDEKTFGAGVRAWW